MNNYQILAKKLDWEHWLQRPYFPFISSLCHAGVDPKYFKKVGLPGGYPYSFYQFPNIVYSKKLKEANTIALNKYLARKSIFDISSQLVKIHGSNKRVMIRLVKNNKLSALDKLIEAREVLRSYYPFLWILLSLEVYYNNKLAAQAKKYTKGNWEEFVGYASIPLKQNVHGRMLSALSSGQSLQKVQKKFGWLKSRDGFTDFYSLQELREIKNNIKAEKKIKVKIPVSFKKLFSEVRELAFFRTDRTDKYYEILGLVQPIFREVAEYIKIPFSDLKYYDAESVLVGKPKKISPSFSFVYMKNKQFIQSGPLIKLSATGKQEIKGITAFKGLARGRVKVIVHPSELVKIRRGDILVSQMTFPSFIVAMQKAAAFVTDEGGITCHAAIIAREMKKPCIIGTKNATKVLKDGDLVEVNADVGVVNIIRLMNKK